ncbi:MAG TPA: ferrous iron transport protein B, partial [Planctomycetes bacterium]|nr:ferrous iron transport protein B [Planctomycetota bacterium]
MPTPNGPHRIAVAGNPNTGKTTLFNRLTGSRAKVGNYPGVTVDRRVGKMKLPGAGEVEVIDVPGTYSLAARSAEEQVAISVVAGLPPYERPDLVVAVVDATNLIRNLYLVLQLIELGSPVVVALNMVDLLEESGQHVHPKKLQEALGVPVVDIVALRGEGLAPLLVCIDQVLEDPSKGLAPWPWSPEEDPLLDADVRSVEAAIPEEWADPGTDRAKALALWALLSVDDHDELLAIPPELRDVVERKRHLAEISGRRIEEEIIRGRYDWLDAAAPLFLHDSGAPVTFTDRADRLLLHPALGFVVFLGLMGLVFQSLFAWADPAISAIERAFAWLADSAAAALPPGLPTDLLVGGVIPGVGSVLVFLPQILLLFFFIGVMEDTGYMARVAYLMDRIMKLLGLHGRAFVPMLSGYACAVPAILATRTMERRRDRLLTMMVVPLMTCSARLPVYGLLIATLVPPGGGNAPVQGLLLTGMYLFSTIVTLAAAAVLGRTILPGKRTPLLLEMPPYRMPHWPSLLRMLWERCWVFLREAGTVILLCTIAIWALLSFPRTSPEGEHFEVLR